VAGENEFLITPHFGGSLTRAGASYKNVFGEVLSRWELKEGEFLLEVTIADNCIATIIMPNGGTEKVESGRYSFEMLFG